MDDDIDWDNEAPVMYHSSFDSDGFSKLFRHRYKLLSGEKHLPDPWLHDHVRIDNRLAVQVVKDIGIDKCGKNLTIAVIPRRALPALEILEADGAEYPDLNTNKYIVHYLQEYLANGHVTIPKKLFDDLITETKSLHLRIISRTNLSPMAEVSNRYSCLCSAL